MNHFKEIVFGGGCFWCTEAMFLELPGVEKVESGYAGGNASNPTYEEVCAGKTGHAEVIKVTYNPEKVDLKNIIKLHLLSHDPTTINRQGADTGTQYRSIIFYQNEEEKNLILNEIKEVQTLYKNPIATEVKKLDKFYKAEDYHQNYFNQNRFNGYCMVVISPKLAKFRKLLKVKNN